MANSMAQAQRDNLLAQELLARVAAERATQRIARLQAVSAACSAALTLEQMADVVLDQILQPGVASGLVALLTDDHAALQIVRARGYPSDTLTKWQSLPLDAALPFTEAIRNAAAIWLESSTTITERYPLLSELCMFSDSCALIVIPLIAHSQVLGCIGLSFADQRTFEADERSFILALAQVCSQFVVAHENTRLFEQVQADAESLRRMSQQLVRAQEDERRRIARELHDQVGQSLTAALLNLQMLAHLPDPSQVPARLDDSMAQIEHVLQQIRTLSLSLRPALLDDLGLAPALRWLVSRQAERAGFDAIFQADSAGERFTFDIETTCFRVVQEAITNIVRYAQPQRVTVELRKSGAELCVSVRDDGVGFDVAAALQAAAHGHSMGLLGMQERVSLLGGQLRIESAPGQGARIDMRLPLVLPESKLQARASGSRL